MNSNRVLFVLFLVAVACGCAFAQSTGATLQGTLTDPTGSVMPNVKVDLKGVESGVIRETVSTSEGIFRFNGIAPAVYDLSVKSPVGFSEYSQTGITLNASEIRELGTIKLTVGAVNQKIEITSAATPVQTASSENSSTVDFEQFKHITVRGRDLLSLMQTLPGVTFGTNFLTGGSSGQGNNETNNPFALGQMNLNGMGSQANFTVDGVTGMDTAGDGLTTMRPNVDAVAEVRVLATNYAAEYGRNIGGQIQVVTKSGGQQFHGTAGVNKRHEMFNANSFFNNYNGKPKDFYRFMVENYSIGGPVYIPKVFTQLRNRVFFFVSQEYLGQRSNPASGYANVPSPNQRKGDFSYYPNGQGNFIANSLQNPTTGQKFTPWNGQGAYNGAQDFSQFANQFDAQSQKWGQAMLNALPLPNLCNASAGTSDGKVWNGIASGVGGSNLISPANCPSWITSQATGLATGNVDAQGGPGTNNNYTRNYYWINNGSIARRNDIFKLDFHPTSKITASVMFGRDHFLDNSAAAIPSKDVTTGQFLPTSTPHPNPGKTWAVNMTYAVSPTIVNQLTLGWSWNDYAYDLNAAQLDRGNMLNPPSFHNFAKDPLYNQAPVARPESSAGQPYFQAGYPTANFGGGQYSEANVGQPFCNGTCPNYNFNPMYQVSDSISKAFGKHNFKVGVAWEWGQKVETSGNNSQGTYNFSGADDPFFQSNTLDGFANAYLGNFKQYTEGQRILSLNSSVALEAFVQDSWRVSRRLTLDLGVRFSHLPAMQDVSGNSTMFLPSSYSAAQAERIFYPYCSVSTAAGACPKANQYTWDPATNPNAVIGTGQGGPGNMYPSYVAAGTLVPNVFNGKATGGYTGTPNPYTGMQQITYDNPLLPLQNGVYQVPKFSPGIRIGFAWDVFGDGKTAIRGGFGQNLRRLPNGQLNARRGGPPVTQSMSAYYGTIASLLTNPLAGYTQDKLPPANQVVGISPFGATSLTGYQKYESTYNGSFNIQRDLGFATVAQVGYVMNLDRHAAINTPANTVTSLGVPFGHGVLFNQLQPKALDPTLAYLDQYMPGNACVTFTNGACTSGRNLSDDFFRTQFPGYGAVTMQGFGGNQDIHSLQGSVRRNFTKRFSFTGAYTWIKVMSLSGRSQIFDDKYRNWQPTYPGNTPMWATFTYVYQAPNLSQVLHFKPIKYVTDNWEVSGVTQVKSNMRQNIPTIGFANTNGTNLVLPNWTGTSGEGQRMLVVGDWKLPSDQVSFLGGSTTQNIGVNGTPGNALINNGAFMAPPPCSLTPQSNARTGIGMNMACFGNAGPGQLLTIPGTGVNNWDMTFTKRFPFKSEQRQLLFRAEIYNIFNHTQFVGQTIGQNYDWNAYKTSGTLNPTNGSTGRYTTATAPRIMSLALRFQF